MSAPCTCPAAGYCARLKKHMTEHQHGLCQTRPDYRALWDADAAGQPPPSLAEQVVEATKAYARWLAAGRPVRSPEQIEACMAACAACDKMVDGQCRACGCHQEPAFFGLLGLRAKAEMATEACPHPKGSQWSG